ERVGDFRRQPRLDLGEIPRAVADVQSQPVCFTFDYEVLFPVAVEIADAERARAAPDADLALQLEPSISVSDHQCYGVGRGGADQRVQLPVVVEIAQRERLWSLPGETGLGDAELAAPVAERYIDVIVGRHG